MLRRGMSTNQKFAAVAVAFVALCIGALAYVFLSRETGASCSRDDDCNSRMCVLGWGGEGVCTETCREDDDCPGDMRCGGAQRTGSMVPFDSGERRVCMP